MADDYSLSSKARLLKLANDENPGALLSDNTITIGDPAITTANGKNTVVVFTGKPGSIRFGERPYYYDRLDLALFFQDELDMAPGPLPVTINDYTTAYDLLPRIRAMYNIGIAEDDVINEVVNSTSYVLKAKTTSLGWIGQVTLDIQPLLTELSTYLTVLTLPLFNPTIFGTASSNQLLARINLANGTNFTFNDVEFTAVTPLAGETIENDGRIVMVTGKPEGLLTGTVNIQYVRRLASDIYPDPLPTSYEYQTVTNETTLLNLLTNFDNVILVDSEVDRTTTGPDPDLEELTANGASLLWTTGSNFYFDAPKIPLASSAFSKNWNGLFASDIDGLYVQMVDVMNNLANDNTNLVADNHPIRWGTTGQVLTTDHFLMNSATLTESAGAKNTTVLLSATATNPRYTGSAIISYDRVDAAQVFTTPVNVHAAGPLAGTTTRTILSALNTIVSTGIVPGWIEDLPVADEETNITLTFLNNQFLFEPGTSLSLIVHREASEFSLTGALFILDDGGNFLLDDGGRLILDHVIEEHPSLNPSLILDDYGFALVDGGGHQLLDEAA